jgi:hypothetical protein
MAQPSDQEFSIGLAMAGAVSAGAYSAGVLDFLLQALAEWEDARAGTESDAIPNHRVGIKVITGASAGAITGALGAVALAGGLDLREVRSPKTGTPGLQCVLPSLYGTWVVEPRMVSASGAYLLGQDDLKDGEPVCSVLDSTLLDQIKKSALRLQKRGPEVPYIAKSLHVYMMVSNLRGLPYSEKFKGGEHGMLGHGERVHYLVAGLGNWNSPSAFADSDAPEIIDVDGLFQTGGPSAAWLRYGDSALASSAFPVGLAPRQITLKTTDYDARRWPLPVLPQPARLAAKFPWGSGVRDFTFLSVDGGLINNEPFEYARYSLMQDPPNPNARAGTDATRAVIMIDPFPEAPDFLPDNKPERALASLVAAILPAMKNQARFKPSELLLALQESIYSRFIVAPHRTLPNREKEETFAIACGLLGGFGGFLDEQFRAHDFQLGRRNCQRFLRESFALLADNPVIKAWPAAAKADRRFQTTPETRDEIPQHTIIPLLGSAADPVELPDWPQLSTADFEILQDRIRDRLDAIAPALIRQQTASTLLRWTLGFAVWLGKGRILKYLRGTILADLVRRNQIKDWELPPEWNAGADAQWPDHIRMVIAELVNPAFDLRTEAGIARATHLDAGAIHAVLDGCTKARGKPFSAWSTEDKGEAGRPRTLYTLVSRKPSWFSRLPVIRSIGDWLSAPAID